MSTDLNVWVGVGVDRVDTEAQSRVGMDGGWRAPLAAALGPVLEAYPGIPKQ